MSTSTNGILAYGYDLGGEEGWKVQEIGEYDELNPLDWYDPESEEGDDFQSAAERRLLVAAGFTETDWRVEGYFTREREAKARLGVEFDTYCSGEFPEYLLATEVITVYRGDVETIDMAALAVKPEANGWDDKLRAALTVLGLTPTQEQAKWLLCSYWG